VTKTFVLRDLDGYRTLSGWVVGSADDAIVVAAATVPGAEPTRVLIARSTIVGEFPTAA